MLGHRERRTRHAGEQAVQAQAAATPYIILATGYEADCDGRTVDTQPTPAPRRRAGAAKMSPRGRRGYVTLLCDRTTCPAERLGGADTGCQSPVRGWMIALAPTNVEAQRCDGQSGFEVQRSIHGGHQRGIEAANPGDEETARAVPGTSAQGPDGGKHQGHPVLPEFLHRLKGPIHRCKEEYA